MAPVELTGWCGRCGQRFQLTEVLAPPHAGQCPSCAEPFAADYTPVVATALQAFGLAAAALAAAGSQLGEMAPRLHLDAAGLADQLHAILDH